MFRGFIAGFSGCLGVLVAVVFLLFVLAVACGTAVHTALADDEPSNVILRYYCVAATDAPTPDYFQAGQVWISGQQFPLFCEPVYP